MANILEKFFAAIKCWWNGHDPDLSLCQKTVIPYREMDLGHTVIRMMGRNLYFGPTVCKCCGKRQYVNGR